MTKITKGLDDHVSSAEMWHLTYVKSEEEEDLPDLQDKDVERVTKKMQIAFRSKKLPGTPPYMAEISEELIT